MVRNKTRVGLGAFSLLAGVGLSLPMAAQTLWVPASDPVGIARAGTGVAYGTSLEAGSLNPALLVTLRENASAFVSAGMDMQSSQSTLQSNSQVLFSSDRNRFLPALGAAWKVTPTFYMGLKIDEPFLRHVQMPDQYSGRFTGQNLNLTTHRVELQGSWAATPALSFGLSAGVTRVQYSFENSVRVEVPDNPALASNATGNPVRGLQEVSLIQQGNKILPSWTLGFRWAINPRWTLAGTYQGAIRGTLPLTGRVDTTHGELVGISGFGPADGSAAAAAPVVLGASTLTPGSGTLALPGRLTLGIRQRVNQIFTWEGDLHYVQGASLLLPGYATLATPSGTVGGSGFQGNLHSGTGLSLMGEMNLSKNLTLRLGVSQEAGLREDPYLEPLLGGGRCSNFAGGLGYRMWGGELNVGWMTRISQYRDVKGLDGAWSENGYSTTGTLTRVSDMGHLWSVGFKKVF